MTPPDSPSPPTPPPPSRRRRVARAGVALLFLGLLGAGACLLGRPPFQNWAEVEAHAMYRSALLPAEEMEEAVRRYGIRTVVNLRPDRDALREAERATLERLGVALLDVPLAGSSPPSPAQADELRRLFEDPARLPALVHCRHGSVRAAGIEAFYRHEYLGEDAATALATSSRFGHDIADEAPRIRRFIESLPARPVRLLGSRAHAALAGPLPRTAAH